LRTNRPILYLVFLLVSLGFLAACSSQKNTAINRKLQSLSARYNYIYNANVLLDEYLEKTDESITKDFNSLLPAFYAPQMADVKSAGTKINELEQVEQKARDVIAEKNLSSYIDEAYLLLGKTNFYQGKYYNALAYFDYVARGYKKDRPVLIKALNWKARSLMQLADYNTASKILDTVLKELDSVKKGKAEVYATLSEMNSIKQQDQQSIDFLLKALQSPPTKYERLNWTYRLAQLYDKHQDPQKSLAYYTKIVKSNAPFELYFNAKINSVRLNALLGGQSYNKREQLQKMLKDDKNNDFVDQIYYEIAQDYAAANDYKSAENYYKTSISKSTKNSGQKALAYLKLAELNEKQYSDYASAKLYYDSTVMTLPRNHQQYKTITNKAANLSFIQKRVETIRLEDSLQSYAKLPEQERAAALSRYFEKFSPNAKENRASEGSSEDHNDGSIALATTRGNSSFYFNNPDALSRGYNEFIKTWGTRKLTNNWRNNSKKNEQAAVNTDAFADMSTGATDPDAPLIAASTSQDQSSKYLDSIPLSPAQLEKSNQKIIKAYVEMGDFYHQVIKDKAETARTFETLLARFPNNSYQDRAYYSLYLAYKDINPSKANHYSALVLQQYPNSVFAKTILDPNFSTKKNELEQRLRQQYEVVFGKLQEQKYTDVISEVTAINKRFPNNSLAPQFDYLKALAIGYTSPVKNLVAALTELVKLYPNDKLIKPLATHHIAFINANMSSYSDGKKALKLKNEDDLYFKAIHKNSVRIDEPIIANVLDPTGKKEASIFNKPVLATTTPTPQKTEEKPQENKPLPIVPAKPIDTAALPQKQIAAIKPEAKTLNPDTVEQQKTVLKKLDTIASTPIVPKDSTTTPVVTPPVKQQPIKDELFSDAPAKTYYFVVAVRSAEYSLSSSRFGIGQFNRGNYSGANLRHQLLELSQDQLIYVGDFSNIGEAKNYQTKIREQLGVIMKISPNAYTSFVCSKENFEKIVDRNTLDRYIKYFESNVQ